MPIRQFAPVQKKPDDPQPRDPRRAALAGFIIIVLLVIAGLFLTHVLRNLSSIQDCVMQGRTNCAPLDSTSGR
jgi:hypothetical protein